MIKTIKGDALSGAEDMGGILVHGCNAQGVMGSGIAAQIRKKWPEVYDSYYKMHNGPGLQLGAAYPCLINENLIVVNAITQKFYLGHPNANGETVLVDYDDILNICIEINMMYPRLYPSYKRILHFPMIGAGLAGGDWERIEEIIDSHVTNYEKILWLYNG